MFFKRQFKRRIKTDILFQNLATIIVTVTLIVSYNYVSSKRSTIEQSEHYIRSSTKFVSEKISVALDSAENVVNIYVPLIEKLDLNNFQCNLKLYESYLTTVKALPFITTVYYGTEKGLFVEFNDLEKADPFLKTISIVSPEGAKGVIRSIMSDDSGGKNEFPETWLFMLENGELSSPTSTQRTKFDTRRRPWYKESIKTQNLIWTDIYVFTGALKGAVGITASRSIINQDGMMAGVFAADITMKSFSEFLAQSKPSPNGNIFIIDREGHIVSSSEKIDIISEGDKAILPTVEISNFDELKVAYKKLKTNSGSNEIEFLNIGGKEYMALKTSFPKKLPGEWSMYVVAPLDDFVGAIKDTGNNILYFSILVSLIAALSSYSLARSISKPLTQLSNEANKIKELNFEPSAPVNSSIKEINELSHAIAALKTSIHSFSYYIPKTLVKRLLQRKQTIQMGGRNKVITLFFSDIEGFTNVSEGMTAERLSVHLCDYFEALGSIITPLEGTIDKYIGDAIMAFWGAPIPDRHHQKNACKAALLCQKKLAEMNRVWKKEGQPQLKTRIGIHTGDAIVGNIGSLERMNYTALGDSVNLCSRMEGLNKYYGTQIIISETVLGAVKDVFYVRSLDYVAVRGKTKPMKIYELVGVQSDDPSLLPSEDVLIFNERFEQAYHLYLTRQFADALKAFKDIDDTLRANDLSVMMYIERCEQLMKTPPEKDWDGRYMFDKK